MEATTDAELRDAVAQVMRAIRVEGRSPTWHRRVMARHRAEWPTLWRALDRLAYASDRERTDHQ